MNGLQHLFSPKSSVPLPTPKDYVTMLMEVLPNTEHQVESPGSSSRGTNTLEYRNFKCPNKRCHSKGKNGEQGVYSIAAKKGYTNVKRHLLKCHANNNQTLLQSLFETEHQGEPSVKDFFDPVQCVTPKAAYIHKWMKLIISKNLPLKAIEDPVWDSFMTNECVHCASTENVSAKTLKKVIFKTVELIQEKIKKEMTDAGKGSILSDGWTKHGTHYIGLLVAYNKEVVFTPLGDTRKKNANRFGMRL